MDLKDIGFLLLSIGIVTMATHFFVELSSIYRIRKWLKKNKSILLLDKDILDMYTKEVVESKDYSELKQIYDEAPFVFKKASLIGLNYLDLHFFQKLISYYYNKDISENEILHKEVSFGNQDIINRLKKILWIVLSFNISHLFKSIGLFFTKFTVVYFVVVFIYEKLF